MNNLNKTGGLKSQLARLGKDRFLKILSLYLFIALISTSSFGQQASLEFDHYTTNNGLSNGYIYSIFQDSRGFIWFGTANGLNRFDGITFKTYYSDPKDPTSIPGSVVTSLAEDSTGKIWVMTTNGFCSYDRKTDVFSRKSLKVAGEKVNVPFLNTCLIDHDGYLWIGSSTGILRFKIYNNPQVDNNLIEAEMYHLDEHDVTNVFKNIVYSIIEDNERKIWIVSYSSSLFCFDEKVNSFISHPINYPEAGKFSNFRKGMLMDRDGDFYITIEDNGLLVWYREKNQFCLYKAASNDNGPRGNILFALEEDKNGSIWIGDRSAEGISIFNKKTGKFTSVQAVVTNPHSLISNKISCIYRDKSGSMWVGTIIGINKFSPGKVKFNRYFSDPLLPDKLSFNNVLCFAESKNGDIWIGTDGGGLNRLDHITDKFFHYTHDPSNRGSISSNSIVSLCEDHEGTLWMGTFDGGLARLKDNSFYAFYPDPANPYSISNKNIWYVLEDSKLNLWAATLNSGLELFDAKTGRFYHYTNHEGDLTSICSNVLLELYEDSRQRLYITTYQGISIIDLKNYDFSKFPVDIKFRTLRHSESMNSISNDAVYCAKEDNEGNLWFGTIGTGIDKLDSKTGKFTNYSTKDGLPGNYVSSILVDEFNNLWLATDKGLARFNPDSKEVDVYDLNDGLQNLNLKSWAIRTRYGKMFIGGPDGFNSFYPGQVRQFQNPNRPSVVITGLKIFNEPVKINEKFNDRIILSRDISETGEIKLTFKENFFTLYFVALDYTTPENNSYAYMMEGFNNGWINCGVNREANYTNLDPGTYTFRVKASNNDGIWNDKGVSLKVIILPPWWKTLLFRIILVVTVTFTLGYIFFSRVRYLKNQKIVLEKLVTEKTFELQGANNTLITQAEVLNETNLLLKERQLQIEKQREELLDQQETLLRMNQELKEVNATKDKFFSIIAHDIKNPFSAIMGVSEMLEESYMEWSDEKRLESVQLIADSSKTLYQLLENLLHWSRSQRGTLEFNPEKIDLTDFLNNITELFKGSAEAKNIRLFVTLPDRAHAVKADRQMLGTILRNLVTNAIKYTRRGGIVQIITEVIPGFVIIKVADNGVGMTKADKERLFKIDSHNATPGTENEKGTGLGLVLAGEFIHRNGGEIGVESVLEKGSTFHFTLPLWEDQGN
jgi:signal transduction histidine kinase/ligand-binding sensor domain-containing protein